MNPYEPPNTRPENEKSLASCLAEFLRANDWLIYIVGFVIGVIIAANFLTNL